MQVKSRLYNVTRRESASAVVPTTNLLIHVHLMTVTLKQTRVTQRNVKRSRYLQEVAGINGHLGLLARSHAAEEKKLGG